MWGVMPTSRGVSGKERQREGEMGGGGSREGWVEVAPRSISFQ